MITKTFLAGELESAARELMAWESLPSLEVGFFGGSHKDACRLMFCGALVWIRANPDAVLHWNVVVAQHGFTVDDDTKALQTEVSDLVPGCSDATYGAAFNHALWCSKRGLLDMCFPKDGA